MLIEVLCLQENVHCQACSKDTHQHDYVQYFFNVMSTSIGFQGILLPDQSLGQHLKDIEDQSRKSCDSDKGAWSTQALLPLTVACPCRSIQPACELRRVWHGFLVKASQSTLLSVYCWGQMLACVRVVIQSSFVD